MRPLCDKHVLLGVTGGIAAYKCADLVRRLRAAGAEVRVVMTPAATRFVSPITLQALSGQPVRTQLFDEQAEAAMGHIELARWADLVLVAPATAHFIARLAHGLADELLTTLCLATTAPLVLAPAMNRTMWEHPSTQGNCRLLEARGVRILGPASGEQACGEMGPGRMLEPEALAEALAAPLSGNTLERLKVLVTAGPTREDIDPVRFLSNRSSGKMGYAIAGAAVEAGASVTLVSGPVALATPRGVQRLDITSTADLFQAVLSRVHDCDIFIAAAAPADYRVAQSAGEKIKKSAAELTLTLTPTEDVLATVAGLATPPFTVGFAAETENVEANARAKLVGKKLDMIAANRVGVAGTGFESDENCLQVLWADGAVVLERTSKQQLARQLVQLIARRHEAKRRALSSGADATGPA